MRNPVRTTRPAAAPLLVAIALLLWHGAGFAERKALVIGNSKYAERPLGNPVHDAEDMGKRLRGLQFGKVTVVPNADKKAMIEALRTFSASLRPTDDAVIFYAGHAAQIKDHNYLIPLGADIKDCADLEYEAVDLGRVLDALAPAEEGLKLAILDACRDNPYPSCQRSGARGLARMEHIPTGTLIWYAAKPGETADDGDGRNGLFTQHLLDGLNQPGLSVDEAFKWTARAVSQATGGKKMPYLEGYTLANFVFLPGTTDSGRLASAPEPPPVDPPPRQRPVPDPAPSPSRTLKTGDIIRDPMKSGGQGPVMVYIQGGSFEMGSPAGELGRSDDERQHEVSVGGFFISQTEVTFSEYDRFAKATGRPLPGAHGWGRDKRPVINVSWQDAADYTLWLRKETGQQYQLPTEAEWEYAARAGTRTAFWWGDVASHEYANYGKEECCKGLAKGNDRWINSAPTGSFDPNHWGIYDTAGNVWEWTCSTYDKEYGGAESRCANSGKEYTVRGGGWNNEPVGVRCGHRYRFAPSSRGTDLGFRLSRIF